MKLAWLTTFRDYFFPACCLQCRQLCHNQIDLCTSCENALPRILLACPICRIPNDDGLLCPNCYYHPPTYSKMICPYLYRDPLPHFIHSLKFSSKLIYAKLLGELLLRAVESESEGYPECLLPMPLHVKRTRFRGFNQSLEMSKIISRRLNIPIELHKVIRCKNTQAQSKMTKNDRRNNMIDAFQVTGVLPKHVAIIDDVVTTGTTIESLARCLKKNGVSKIEVWCAARTTLH